MPVTKFRSFEEARRALWMTPGDPLILDRMKRLGELARPRPVRRGVFRYSPSKTPKRRSTPPVAHGGLRWAQAVGEGRPRQTERCAK
jgi:hypothetical protein